ncbi:hypothetical protein CY35_19G072500 [Sphagnum magellanicum]|nr:hypothetical protein CY35_19G072500 [Sphagnum magellanicum]
MALAVPQIMSCCGSTRFATEMALVGPFSSLQSAIDSARDIWWNKVDIPGWLEAFSAHPRIGDIQALRTKFSSESSFCEGEQSSALNSSNEHILQELAELNRQYEAKFGFVFLVCASGKSSAEILSILKARFRNRPILELQIAAAEQQKITELRLAKLMSVNSQLSSSAITEGDTMQVEKVTSPTDLSTNQNLGSSTDNSSSEVIEKLNPATSTVANLRPPITTHVLDVTLGRPGSGIDVALHWWTQTSPSAEKISDGDENGFWVPLGKSVTNNDGRAGPLMPTSNKIQPGIYRLTFNTGTYLTRTNSSVNQQEGVSGGFYPYVMIVFEVKPSQVSEHFHVPVLLSPYAFSTYRGS